MNATELQKTLIIWWWDIFSELKNIHLMHIYHHWVRTFSLCSLYPQDSNDEFEIALDLYEQALEHLLPLVQGE